jgi:polyisoprenoid-binding protein YceI
MPAARHDRARWAIALAALAVNASGFGACWEPAEEEPELRFAATHLSGPIPGRFTRLEGEICIDPEAAGGGRIELIVPTASVRTALPEMDEALRGAEFFDTERWPQARFAGSAIEPLGGERYRVSGELTIRDVTRRIEVPFTLEIAADGSSAQVSGETRINRLDYEVGLGEWRETRWLADEVRLEFSVRLSGARRSAPRRLARR